MSDDATTQDDGAEIASTGEPAPESVVTVPETVEPVGPTDPSAAPAPTSPPPAPPVDNEHVAEGAEQFTPEVIAQNAPEPEPEAAPPPDYPPPAPPPSRADMVANFVGSAKISFRAALAAQPHRGTPSFDDLKCVADAIIDSIAEAMRG